MKPAAHDFNGETEVLSASAVFTFVLWIACATVSIAGFIIPYSRPHTPPPVPSPVQAEILDVRLTAEERFTAVPEQTRSPDPVPKPPPVESVLPRPAPPLIPVMQATPAIAFPLPVDGPVRIVPAREVAYTRPTVEESLPPAAAPAAQGTPERLVYGQGEGVQPAPEYPRRALTAGQQGTVVVRFTVGESGRVVGAEASSASSWPLLNEAAVRVVRERWRFQAGGMRLYEVAIHFQLQK